jgi:hypothetical protein
MHYLIENYIHILSFYLKEIQFTVYIALNRMRVYVLNQIDSCRVMNKKETVYGITRNMTSYVDEHIIIVILLTSRFVEF